MRLSSVYSNIEVMKLSILPPERLHKPLVVPKRLQLTPGPSNLHEQIRKAMFLPMIGDLDEEYEEVMEEVKAGLYSRSVLS